MTGIVLRPPIDADRALLALLRADAELQALLLGATAADADEVEAWIARRMAEPGGAFLVVAAKATGEAIGYVQVAAVHRRDRHGHGGIALAPGARGRGLGRAAMLALMRHARDHLSLRKLLLEVRADNAAARALYAGLGFREVGIMTAHAFVAGALYDVVLLERLLEESGP